MKERHTKIFSTILMASTGTYFTIELEQNGTLPFLDVLVKKNADGTLAHTMYRKTTNTGLYLHVDSEHHPAQTRTVLSTLTYRA